MELSDSMPDSSGFWSTSDAAYKTTVRRCKEIPIRRSLAASDNGNMNQPAKVDANECGCLSASLLVSMMVYLTWLLLLVVLALMMRLWFRLMMPERYGMFWRVFRIPFQIVTDALVVWAAYWASPSTRRSVLPTDSCGWFITPIYAISRVCSDVDIGNWLYSATCPETLSVAVIWCWQCLHAWPFLWLLSFSEVEQCNSPAEYGTKYALCSSFPCRWQLNSFMCCLGWKRGHLTWKRGYLTQVETRSEAVVISLVTFLFNHRDYCMYPNATIVQPNASSIFFQSNCNYCIINNQLVNNPIEWPDDQTKAWVFTTFG